MEMVATAEAATALATAEAVAAKAEVARRTLLSLPPELLSKILAKAFPGEGVSCGLLVRWSLTCKEFKDAIYCLPIWSLDLVTLPAPPPPLPPCVLRLRADLTPALRCPSR